MYSLGDRLLFILSAKRGLPGHVFSTLLARSLAEHSAASTTLPPEDLRFIRYRTTRVMESLGYCDIDYSDGTRILACPPVFVRLPILGLPRFQLLGSRSPALMIRLHGLRKQFGADLRLNISPVRSELVIPARVELEASESTVIELVSSELGIPYQPHPAAFLGISHAGSLREYRAGLEWQSGCPTSTTERHFNIQDLCFRQPTQEDMAPQRLVRWIDYVKQRRRYFIIESERHARVDPDWARYVVLNSRNRNVLLFDRARNLLAVPSRTPLPKPIERAIALCSGEPPSIVRRGIVQSTDSIPSDLLVYKSVSAGFAEIVSQKLEQVLTVVSINI